MIKSCYVLGTNALTQAAELLPPKEKESNKKEGTSIRVQATAEADSGGQRVRRACDSST